jgi:hypothetical protein
MSVTALREAALGERRLERGPTPGRHGASCGAGLMNQGDDRREEHRGKDHKKDEEREQILGHLLLTFLSERGAGGDLNRCDPVSPKCLETEPHPPLPIGRFSSAKGGKSTRRRCRIDVAGPPTGWVKTSARICDGNVGVGLSDRFASPLAQDPTLSAGQA